jgi:hypothetical protein
MLSSDLNKWFTRIRKRIDGPPGFTQRKGRTYWNCDREVPRAIGVTSFKFAMPGTLHVGFAGWTVFDCDMSNHWYRPCVDVDDAGFVIERYADVEAVPCEGAVGSDRYIVLRDDNCDECADHFVGLYETQLRPWLEGFNTPQAVLNYIQKHFPQNVLLPLTYKPQDRDLARSQVGQTFANAPDRQDDRYVDWLEKNGIVTKDECVAIKRASIQAIDRCVERIRSIGARMAGSM